MVTLVEVNLGRSDLASVSPTKEDRPGSDRDVVVDHPFRGHEEFHKLHPIFIPILIGAVPADTLAPLDTSCFRRSARHSVDQIDGHQTVEKRRWLGSQTRKEGRHVLSTFAKLLNRCLGFDPSE